MHKFSTAPHAKVVSFNKQENPWIRKTAIASKLVCAMQMIWPRALLPQPLVNANLLLWLRCASAKRRPGAKRRERFCSL